MYQEMQRRGFKVSFQAIGAWQPRRAPMNRCRGREAAPQRLLPLAAGRVNSRLGVIRKLC